MKPPYTSFFLTIPKDSDCYNAPLSVAFIPSIDYIDDHDIRGLWFSWLIFRAGIYWFI
jgi:hypothetical protein